MKKRCVQQHVLYILGVGITEIISPYNILFCITTASRCPTSSHISRSGVCRTSGQALRCVDSIAAFSSVRSVSVGQLDLINEPHGVHVPVHGAFKHFLRKVEHLCNCQPQTVA